MFDLLLATVILFLLFTFDQFQLFSDCNWPPVGSRNFSTFVFSDCKWLPVGSRNFSAFGKYMYGSVVA